VTYRGWDIEQRTGNGYAWVATRSGSAMMVSADTKALLMEMIDAEENDQDNG
jgi:hypothetical protein